ncbi:hypothetical protein AV530_011974 [Patagioenas fasciata monilis]|uniref:Uncharacterized protein n=1 Tax=Patagioenas fasciata monilis TaxID=372326 RepID=A0A1V4JUI1_PATFA|nr:hypothetical protein AV530_011974 [Patagioenas fasciata monilis]
MSLANKGTAPRSGVSLQYLCPMDTTQGQNVWGRHGDKENMAASMRKTSQSAKNLIVRLSETVCFTAFSCLSPEPMSSGVIHERILATTTVNNCQARGLV